ncbi:MAG: hypothetical protein M3R36_15600 [Bacteroidota bacterium]|nr:hypothetical protein [Bacteroidota bacterium]
MKQFRIILIISIIIISGNITLSQTKEGEERITDVEKKSLRNISWVLSQLIPSPTWLNDRNGNNNSVNFAFRWQITPLNISFSTNKFVTPVQFFFVNPMRKYTGSLEFFVQPEFATASFENSGYNKLGIGVGSRINIPVKNYGEHLYVSLGGKYNFRKNELENKNGYYGIEGGIYAIFGLLGLQFNYNFDKNTRYNFGIYFKYW